MFRRSSKAVLVLLAVLFIVTSSIGCARLAKNHRCNPNVLNCSPLKITPKESLRIIDFESRESILLSDVTNPIDGAPIAVDPALDPNTTPVPPIELRDLTVSEVRLLAAKSSPIATRLEAHRDWLCTLNRTPPATLNALTQQARYERSKHVLMSEEAYLNLSNVYSKTPILVRTTDILIESEEAINKLRDAGIDIPGDPQELSRRRLEVFEQFVEVRYNQSRLNDALESLLNLDHSVDKPLWTNFQGQTKPPIPSEVTAIETALSQRGDLVALVLMAGSSETLSIEFLRGGDSGNSLIGAGFELPGPAKFWQCALKNKIECLKKSAQDERKRQLEMLVENKQEQIQLEVRQSLYSVERHESNLKLKLAQIDILRSSMESADKAKDFQPIDFRTRLQQRTDELTLISEIIDELVAIEIEHARLQHVMGY